jgi:DNA-binding GntR family transcriptional regulator
VAKLDPNDSRPPFQQIADDLRRAIKSGQLKPGEKLLSHGRLAEDYGVAIGTVKRAFAELQNEKLIIARQGQGAFVRTNVATEDARDDEIEALRQAVGALTERLEAVERRLADL